MSNKLTFKQWLARAVVGALITGISGAIGWYGRDLYESRQAEAENLAILSNLLHESKAIFDDQRASVIRLMALLSENHGSDIPSGLSADATFSTMYDAFTPEEARQHALLRSTTLTSQHRVSVAMDSWLGPCQRL